jgi:plastocyanin
VKKCALFVLLFLLLVPVLAACDRSGADSTPTVTMGDTNFTQTAITIHKGQSLKLEDTSQQLHTISNGSWVDGEQHPVDESGAPLAQEEQVSYNQSITLGPFNKAGTFHYYCTVHVGMNLTVTVTAS